MEISGSPTSPKGLPLASSKIMYTIFVSLKTAKKIVLDGIPRSRKLFIQGEISIDIPVEICPGEIGVIAYQIEAVPEKVKKEEDGIHLEAREENASFTDQHIQTNESNSAVTEIRKPSEKVKPIFKTMLLSEIHVPKEYLRTMLNREKTAALRKQIRKTGQLDKPIDIVLIDGEYWLTDGYRRYVIAHDAGFTEVPVRLLH